MAWIDGHDLQVCSLEGLEPREDVGEGWLPVPTREQYEAMLH